MSQTRFCDSAGLHVLLAARKRAQADGGGLVLAIGGKAVRRVFEIAGAVSVVPCFPSLEEALAHASGTAGRLTAWPATCRPSRAARRQAASGHRS